MLPGAGAGCGNGTDGGGAADAGSRVDWRRAGAAAGRGAGATAGAAFGSGAAGGSAFMMLMAGIEAAEGKSYLLETGTPVGADVAVGALANVGAPVGAGAAAKAGASDRQAAACTTTLASKVRSFRLAAMRCGLTRITVTSLFARRESAQPA